MRTLLKRLTGGVLFATLAFAQKTTSVSDGGLTFKPEIRLSSCPDVNSLPNVSTITPNIIHYVTWTDNQKDHSDQWLVRGPGASGQSSKRIFGSHSVRILVVHQNIADSTDIAYKVDVKKKSPSWLQNLTGLLGLAAAPVRGCRVGYLDLTDVPVPSDIVVTGKLTPVPVPTAMAAGDPIPPPTSAGDTSNVFTETFDNEGKYWGDFSFGLPTLNKKVTDFEVVDGVLRRKEGSRAAAHGFLSLYPGRRDTKSQDFALPYLLVGLPLTGKALDNPVVAAGMNINQFGIKFGLYAGCAFNRTEVSRNNGLKTDVRWVRKLTIGLNIPVSQFVSAYLKKK